MKNVIFFMLLTLVFMSCGTDNSISKEEESTKCSKTNLTGSCLDGQQCVDGVCTAVCSKDVLDGYCSDSKVCIDGSCQHDMSNITVNLVSNDGKLIDFVKTDEDGKFEIDKENLTGIVRLTITNDDVVLRKRPGRTKYVTISVTNEKGIKVTTDLNDIILENSLFTDNKNDVELLGVKEVKDSKYSLEISGQLDTYECIPKKNVGAPVPGAEITIEQEPNDDPVDNGKTKTTDNGNFCFGKECSGVKLSVNYSKDQNKKGGFAIGGYRLDKAISSKGGFAVGGFNATKAEKSGFHIKLNDLDIMVFRTILAETKEDGKFDINKIYIDSDEENFTALLKLNGSLRVWNYQCE